MISRNTNEKQKKIAVYEFLNKFNILERKIKDDFYNQVTSLSAEERNKLYFYYGGLTSKVLVEYENELLANNKIKFKKNEEFKEFTLNQIIKITESFEWWERYPENIDSLARNIEHTYRGSLIRLLSMRNKLAHELSNLSFKDKDCIELLPKNILEEKLSISFNPGVEDDDQLQMLLSNIVYLDVILDITSLKSE